MASNMKISAKHLAIDKANSTVVVAIGVAAFIVVFSLVASKALLAQRSYQSTVIGKKEAALKQLKTNVREAEKLSISYQEFNGASINVLGGNPRGNGDKDGENPRLVLDALPSKYDFPALATSLNKLVTTNGYKVESIAGVDDELTQAANQNSDSPTPVEMPFTIATDLDISGGKSFLELFERSIRPIQVQKLSITGQDASLTISITAKTYYQPGKNLDIKSEKVIKGRASAAKPGTSKATTK